MCIEHAHLARTHTLNFIRTVAKLKDVAGQTLNRKVLVERADKGFRRLENHPVIRRIGNCAAVCDRRKARAAPAANPMIYCIVMQVSPAPAASRGEAF